MKETYLEYYSEYINMGLDIFNSSTNPELIYDGDEDAMSAEPTIWMKIIHTYYRFRPPKNKYKN